MAILCRYAGIPARVATGFDGGVQNERGGYDLRERDKHAWVEVWFPEYGWQTFDPTEGSIQDNSVNANSFDLSWLWKYLAAVRLYFEIHGVLPVIFLFSIGGGLAYVFKIELYDSGSGRSPAGRLRTIEHWILPLKPCREQRRSSPSCRLRIGTPS